MRILFTVIWGICIAVFVIAGVCSLLGLLFGLSFGILGAGIAVIGKIIFHPVVLVLVIIGLCVKLRKK